METDRCKLTRMVIDQEWDQKVWEEAWMETPEEEQDLDSLRKASKEKPTEKSRPAKRIKTNDGNYRWGEQASPEGAQREDFLRGSDVPSAKTNQTLLKTFSGVEWMSREILKECSHMAVDQAELLRGAEAWEEWQEEDSTAVGRSMSKKEEKCLWARLDELDKEQHKNNQKLQAKKLRAVASARQKMGAGKNQPSMQQMFLASSKPASKPIKAKVAAGSDKAPMCAPRSGWKSSQGGVTSGGSVIAQCPNSQDTLASTEVKSTSQKEPNDVMPLEEMMAREDLREEQEPLKEMGTSNQQAGPWHPASQCASQHHPASKPNDVMPLEEMTAREDLREEQKQKEERMGAREGLVEKEQDGMTSKQLVGSRLDTTPAVPAPTISSTTQKVGVAQLSDQDTVPHNQPDVQANVEKSHTHAHPISCLLYTSPSPRD